jgi:hypothetical protein
LPGFEFSLATRHLVVPNRLAPDQACATTWTDTKAATAAAVILARHTTSWLFSRCDCQNAIAKSD